MKRYYLLLYILLYSLSSFSQEWKRVEADTYSIEIPTDWYTKPIDKTKRRAVELPAKQERPAGPLEEHNLRQQHHIIWRSPEMKEISTMDKAMYLTIRSYVSRDNSPIPFHIVEKVAIASPVEVLDTQRTECGNGKVKVFILEKNLSINRGKIKWHNLCRYSYLQQSEGIVHAIEVSIREKHLKEHPDKLKDIERILNSFEVK